MIFVFLIHTNDMLLFSQNSQYSKRIFFIVLFANLWVRTSLQYTLQLFFEEKHNSILKDDIAFEKLGIQKMVR